MPGGRCSRASFPVVRSSMTSLCLSTMNGSADKSVNSVNFSSPAEGRSWGDRKRQVRRVFSASSLSTIVTASLLHQNIPHLNDPSIPVLSTASALQTPTTHSTVSNKSVPSHQGFYASFTMPGPRPSPTAPLKPLQQIILSHNAIATRNSLSGVKSSYHLFLKNQPVKPEPVKQRKTIPKRLRRDWKAPKVEY